MTAATKTIGPPDVFTPAARWLATAAALSAFFTSIFTGTMVNVAIPDVMGAFGVGQGQAQFLSSAFLAMNTTGLLASSWMIAKLGQRQAFMGVLMLFASAGVLCFVATSLEVVILGRVLQGFAAGILQPLVMLVLFQVFPADRRGLAMGMFSMGVTVALGLGPSIGGITIDAFSWRAIFLAPIPICAFAMLLGFLFLPAEQRRIPAGRFDMPGFLFVNVAVFCWFTLLGNGQRWGWDSDAILMLGVAAALGLLAFVISQRRVNATLLDLSLFGNRTFVTAMFLAFMFAFGNFSVVYAFPIFGQIVQNFTPTIAGSMLLPGSLFAAAVLPIAGRFGDIAPKPFVIAVGISIIAVSVLMLADADPNTVFAYVAFALLIGRFGSALVTPSINSMAVGALTLDQMRRGAGVVNLALMLGGSTGISVFVILLEQRTEFHAVNLAATQTSGNSATMEMLGAVAGRINATGLNEEMQASLAMEYLERVVFAQANMLAFQDGFLALTVITLAPLIPLATMAWKRR